MKRESQGKRFQAQRSAYGMKRTEAHDFQDLSPEFKKKKNVKGKINLVLALKAGNVSKHDEVY